MLEIIEEPLAIGGDAHHPLAQWTFVDRQVASLAASLGGDLFVGEDGTESRTPVHRDLRHVGHAAAIDDLSPFVFAELRPLPAPGIRFLVAGLETAGLELLDQLGDGPCPIPLFVVPGVEDLEKDPLGPAVEGYVGGCQCSSRIVSEPETAHLRLHGGDVGLCRDPGVLSRLDGVLLGGKAEGVVAHGMQNIAAQHPLVAGVDVGRYVTQGVPDMQPDSGWVGEHVHDELLRPSGFEVLLAGVGHAEGLFTFPPILPLCLEFLCHEGGVAMRIFVAGFRLFCFAHADFIRKIRSTGSVSGAFSTRSCGSVPVGLKRCPRLADYPNTGPILGKKRHLCFLAGPVPLPTGIKIWMTVFLL